MAHDFWSGRPGCGGGRYRSEVAVDVHALVQHAHDVDHTVVGDAVEQHVRPGGELRYLEHIASSGARGRLQRLADATVWPRLFGNCHTHRDTERAIAHAGFRPQTARHDLEFPAWVPMPVSEVVIGRAVKPS